MGNEYMEPKRNMANCFRYARLHRPSTDSWLTIDFGTAIDEAVIADKVSNAYNGWELYALSHKPVEL